MGSREDMKGQVVAELVAVSSWQAGERMVGPVNLTLSAGVTHALVGDTDAGAELLTILAGARSPSSGSVHLLGKDLTGGELPPGYSLRDESGNSGVMCCWAESSSFYDPHYFCQWMDRFGIHSRRRAEDLTDAEWALVQLALVLEWRPGALLLLDLAPFKFSESQLSEIGRALSAAATDEGSAILFTTQSPDFARSMADEMTRLLEGKVWCSGPTHDCWPHIDAAMRRCGPSAELERREAVRRSRESTRA
jgi:ABC-type branched-subunit amino acid transport system ATPase component